MTTASTTVAVRPEPGAPPRREKRMPPRIVIQPQPVIDAQAADVRAAAEAATAELARVRRLLGNLPTDGDDPAQAHRRAALEVADLARTIRAHTRLLEQAAVVWHQAAGGTYPDIADRWGVDRRVVRARFALAVQAALTPAEPPTRARRTSKTATPREAAPKATTSKAAGRTGGRATKREQGGAP